MRCYYFLIFHNRRHRRTRWGELFRSAELAVQYGARVAKDIASDPELRPWWWHGRNSV